MPSEAVFSGRTVSERLFAADLLEQWGAASHAHDRSRMVVILQKVELSEQGATTVDEVLAEPKRFGF